MTTTGRFQQCYDHRLRDLVKGTGHLTIATDLGVPRSTARGWVGKASKVVVSLDVTDLKESELRQEVLELRRRVRKLTALLRLALAAASKLGIHVDARASARRTRQDQDPASRGSCRKFVPLRALLRFLRLSPSRFHAWRRLQHACALDDQSSCPHTSPHRLTPPEVRAIKDMVTALEYRHIPTGTLAVLAQGTVWASPSTLVPPGAEVRLAPPPAPRAPGQAEGGPSSDASGRDVAHRHHRHPHARRDSRIPARGDRQLLATDLGVASR